MEPVKFWKLGFEAIIPTLGTPGSGGFDLYCMKDLTITEKIQIVETGIYCIIPKGYVGIIKPRSGLTVNKGIDTKAGVIDSDYRGEIKVVIHVCRRMTQEFPVKIKSRDKIAQLLVVKCETNYEVMTNDEFLMICATERNYRKEGGFGSTDE